MTSNFIRTGMSMLGVALVCMGIYAETHAHGSQTSETDWSEPIRMAQTGSAITT